MNKFLLLCTAIIGVITLGGGCGQSDKTVPREQKWGIYSLDLSTEKAQLIYSNAEKISGLRLNNKGDKFIFAQIIGDANETQNKTIDTREEIMGISTDGSWLERLTDNSVLDTYPAWSSDDKKIYFLSWREKNLDIYAMNSNGSNVELIYDSGSHDADIDNVENKIVFTRNSQTWIMDADGKNPARVTNPPRAGESGKANLPFGDYDPRLSPDGKKIVFERLEGDESVHGNYNLFIINLDGTGETRLTNNGYSQGLPEWSHSGDKIVYVVAAINNEGKYDMYAVNSDGKNNENITPKYFPADLLIHSAIFSNDDSKIFFIGEWWNN